jgi:DNA-binding MarR family transcriptional regulator
MKHAETAKSLSELLGLWRLNKAHKIAGQVGQKLSVREIFILELLKMKGRITIMEMAKLVRETGGENVADSTISTDLMKLWREDKLIAKCLDSENPRQRLITLTLAGETLVDELKKQRALSLGNLLDALVLSPQEVDLLNRVISRATKSCL